MYAMVDDLSKAMSLAIDRAVAVRFGMNGVVASDPPDDFDSVADALLDGLKPDQVEDLRAAVAERLTDPTDVIMPGALRAVDFTRSESVLTQMTSTPVASRLAGVGTDAPAFSLRSEKATRRQFTEEIDRLMRSLQPVDPALMNAANVAIANPSALSPVPSAALNAANFVVTDPELFAPPDLSDFAAIMVEAELSEGVQIPDANFVTTGPIETKYIQLGGENSPLGRPIGPEHLERDPQNQIFRVQRYEGGAIFSDGMNAFAIWGAIYQHWLAIDGVLKPFLGVPRMDQRRTPDNDGEFAHFFGGGSIYKGDVVGAASIHGAIRTRWAATGWERGPLGYPITDETPNDEGPFRQTGAHNLFAKGAIFWSPAHGAHVLSKPVFELYQEHGGPLGNLGHPMNVNASGSLVRFQGGRILTTANGGPEVSTQLKATAFRVTWVTADKTTKEPGRDEIELHIAAIDHVGNDSMSTKVDLGQFRNKTSKTPLLFTQFQFDPMQQPAAWWPRLYTVSYMLVEKDNSRLDNWHLAFLTAVKKQIEKEISKQLGALEIAGGKAGKVASFLVGFGMTVIIEAVFGPIKKSLTKDTVFPPVTISQTFQDMWGTGQPPPQAVDDGWLFLHRFELVSKAGGGRYEITVDWFRDADTPPDS